MIEEGIYALLAADTGVSALVAGRIFAIAGPPDRAQMPYLVYSLVGGSSDQTLRTSGVNRHRLQIDAYAADPNGSDGPAKVAAQIRAAAIAALEGWNGQLSGGINVLDTLTLNPGTDFCTEQMIFRCMAEFYVLYTN